MLDDQTRVWSTAWFTSTARLTVVGVITGALTAAVLTLLVAGLEGGTPLEVAGFLLLAVAVGAACGLPVALACAATGLVAAVRLPQQRAVTIGLLMLWPNAVTAVVVAFVVSYIGYGLWAAALLSVALLGLVSASILCTHRWVLAPLRSPRSAQGSAAPRAVSHQPTRHR